MDHAACEQRERSSTSNPEDEGCQHDCEHHPAMEVHAPK
jgi:hypothetical protein